MCSPWQPALARGRHGERGADLTITRRRPGSDAKRVRTFETLEDQARMFASLPEPSAVRYLAKGVIHERSPRGPRPAPARSRPALPGNRPGSPVAIGPGPARSTR